MRAEMLHDQDPAKRGEYFDVVVFGLASIPGRALGFHVLTAEGAQVARVPLHMLCTKPHEQHLPLDVLELWDCFSHTVSVHAFDFLDGLRVDVRCKDKLWRPGRYMFTVDWTDSDSADAAGPLGHKNAHVIELDCGCLAAQPNNRLRWHEAAFVTKQFPERPDYLTNTHIWSVEKHHVTSDDDRMFYDVEDREA